MWTLMVFTREGFVLQVGNVAAETQDDAIESVSAALVEAGVSALVLPAA